MSWRGGAHAYVNDQPGAPASLRMTLLACTLVLGLCGALVLLSVRAQLSSVSDAPSARVPLAWPLVSAAPWPGKNTSAARRGAPSASADATAALRASREARAVRDAAAAAAATKRARQAALLRINALGAGFDRTKLEALWATPASGPRQQPALTLRKQSAPSRLPTRPAAASRGSAAVLDMSALRAPDKWRAAPAVLGARPAARPSASLPATPSASCARATARARGASGTAHAHECAAEAGAAETDELSAEAISVLLNESHSRPPAPPLVRRLAHCVTSLGKVRTLRRGPRLERSLAGSGGAASLSHTAQAQLLRAAPSSAASAQPEQLLSCAVVGSSDILRLHARASGGALGAQIDAHDVVIRINHAPTRGHERAVGNRTSYRLVNHVLLESWLLPRERRRAEFQTDLCSSTQRDVEVGCLYKERSAARLQLLTSYTAKRGASRMRRVGAPMHAVEDACARALPRAPMSGGFLAVLLAAQARCALPVHVYGFFPFCCHSTPFPTMRYKYYHSEATRWVCCSHSREPMEEEYDLLHTLRALGWVQLHAMPPQDAVGRKCSAVADERPHAEQHAARTVDGPFEPHADVATHAADFDCGELSIDRSACACRVCVAAAPRLCAQLNHTCVGFEVTRGSPHLATLKGSGGALVARQGVTFYALARAGRRARDRYREAADAAAPHHDLPCTPGVRSIVPTAAAKSCVVCAGVAASVCARTTGCTGYTVNKEKLFATLKTGQLQLIRALGATTFIRLSAQSQPV